MGVVALVLLLGMAIPISLVLLAILVDAILVLYLLFLEGIDAGRRARAALIRFGRRHPVLVTH